MEEGGRGEGGRGAESMEGRGRGGRMVNDERVSGRRIGRIIDEL